MRQGSILYYMLIFIASCYIMITHVVLKRYLLFALLWKKMPKVRLAASIGVYVYPKL